MSKKNKKQKKSKKVQQKANTTIVGLVGTDHHILTGLTKKINGVKYSQCMSKNVENEKIHTTTTNWVKSSLIDAISFQTIIQKEEE